MGFNAICGIIRKHSYNLENTYKASTKQPSLFRYATSELSQDAVICWLLEWANHKENQVLQKLAIDLISFLYCLANKNENSIEKVELIDLLKRQYLKIDVYSRARINEKTVLFIIEDKTTACY